MAETSKVGSNIMYICSNLVCKIPGVSAHPKKHFFEPLFFVKKGTNYYSFKKKHEIRRIRICTYDMCLLNANILFKKLNS